MKFKIGDKVKILPSAVDGGVSKRMVGKIGRIMRYSSSGEYFCVLMCHEEDDGLTWAVYPNQIEPVIKVGQQLLLWEDV